MTDLQDDPLDFTARGCPPVDVSSVGHLRRQAIDDGDWVTDAASGDVPVPVS